MIELIHLPESCWYDNSNHPLQIQIICSDYHLIQELELIHLWMNQNMKPYTAFLFRLAIFVWPFWSEAKWQQIKSIWVLRAGSIPNTPNSNGHRTRTPPLLLARVTTRFFPNATFFVTIRETGTKPDWIRSIRMNTWIWIPYMRNTVTAMYPWNPTSFLVLPTFSV